MAVTWHSIYWEALLPDWHTCGCIRPLKRVIQKRILDPIALRIIEGEVKTGDRIDIKNTGGEFVFSVKKIS